MNIIEIDKDEFEKALASSSIFLVDVRENYEFEESNIGGKNIPMGEVLSHLDYFKGQANIYLCCNSGKRSKAIAFHLSQKLPESVIYSLRGGLKEFQNT